MTGKAGRINLFPAIMIMLALISCNSNLIYTDVSEMPDSEWNLYNVPDFAFQVTDTTKSTDIFFSLRTGSQYPYRNIFLFVTTKAPDGKSITDTLEYDIADEKGNWLGKGFGDINEIRLPYKQNVYFPMKGTYHILIRHGMRTGNLKGVYDIGLSVEKYAGKQ